MYYTALLTFYSWRWLSHLHTLQWWPSLWSVWLVPLQARQQEKGGGGRGGGLCFWLILPAREGQWEAQLPPAALRTPAGAWVSSPAAFTRTQVSSLPIFPFSLLLWLQRLLENNIHITFPLRQFEISIALLWIEQGRASNWRNKILYTLSSF